MLAACWVGGGGSGGRWPSRKVQRTVGLRASRTFYTFSTSCSRKAGGARSSQRSCKRLHSSVLLNRTGRRPAALCEKSKRRDRCSRAARMLVRWPCAECAAAAAAACRRATLRPQGSAKQPSGRRNMPQMWQFAEITSVPWNNKACCRAPMLMPHALQLVAATARQPQQHDQRAFRAAQTRRHVGMYATLDIHADKLALCPDGKQVALAPATVMRSPACGGGA